MMWTFFILFLLTPHIEVSQDFVYVLELSVHSGDDHSDKDRYYVVVADAADTIEVDMYDSTTGKHYSINPLHIPLDAYDLLSCCHFGNVTEIYRNENFEKYQPLPDSLVHQVLFNSDLFESLSSKKVRLDFEEHNMLIKLFKVKAKFCYCSPQRLRGYAGYPEDILVLSKFDAEYITTSEDRRFLRRNVASILKHKYLNDHVIRGHVR